MAYLQISKRKNPATGRLETYYRVAWRDGGRESKQQSEALGFISSRREADKLLRGWEVEHGRAAKASKPVAPDTSPLRTVGKLLRDRLLPHLEAHTSPGTVKAAGFAVTALEAKLGGVPVASLTGADTDTYVRARRADGRSAKTIRNELQVLRQALGLALEDGDISKIPTVRRPRKEPVRPHRWHTPEQSGELVPALEQSPDASALVILLVLETGMRRGEALTRGWEDVAWSDNAVLVRDKPAIGWRVKTRDARMVPIPEGLMERLRAAHLAAGSPATGWIFPSDADPAVPRKNFKRALATACRRAGIPVLHPHALRHTYATRMTSLGAPKVVIAEVGGWSRTSAALEDIYTHAVPAQVRDVVERGAVLPSRAAQEAMEEKVLPIRSGGKNRTKEDK